MGAWPGKYLIGLTGNIATGKSVVRKMIEHLGAYGIDADSLANRVLAKGAPGYQPVVDFFGKWILGVDEQVDRKKLGWLVFSDPDALAKLESMIHPHVIKAIDILVRRSAQRVVVIEAIKLIESGLAQTCDTVWVTAAPAEKQLTRLTQKRGMSEELAMGRMNAQSPQELKIQRADVVIQNTGSFEETWNQVISAWERCVPRVEGVAKPIKIEESYPGELIIERGRPRDADEIAAFVNKVSHRKRNELREDIMAAFGEKAFLLLRENGKIRGLVGWKVENLIVRTDEIIIDSGVHFADALRLLMNEVEDVARELQCEISLLFLEADLVGQEAGLISQGYQRRTVHNLGVQAWEEAAHESMSEGSILLFKQLRRDRVLHPV